MPTNNFLYIESIYPVATISVHRRLDGDLKLKQGKYNILSKTLKTPTKCMSDFVTFTGNF